MRSTLILRSAGAAALALLAACCSSGGAEVDPAPPSADAPPASSPDSSNEPAPDPAANSTAPMADEEPPARPEDPNAEAPPRELATLGAGCYWCIEAVLEQIDGVESVVSGFMGGQVENPSYNDVCAGTTGHAEVVQVTFDPAVLSYEELLDWFWRLHDPTTLNRQGADVGTQYRSAIFTHSPAQAEAAKRSLEAAQPSFDDPIVTEISPASAFYEAPEKHQGFYGQNRQQGYCRAVIRPKLKKLGLKE